MSAFASPGRWRLGPATRIAVGAGALALVAAACSSAPPPAAAGHSSMPMPESSKSVPMPSSSMSMGEGMLPMGAEHMHIAIVSPAGTTVTGNSLAVQVRVTGYTDTCALAGKHVMGMEATTTGHYHLLLDGALVNMFCTPSAVVSLQNVKPGTHTLTAVPALDDHAEVTHNAHSVMFDYAPATPLPALTGVTTTGTPAITILSPKQGPPSPARSP